MSENTYDDLSSNVRFPVIVAALTDYLNGNAHIDTGDLAGEVIAALNGLRVCGHPNCGDRVGFRRSIPPGKWL